MWVSCHLMLQDSILRAYILDLRPVVPGQCHDDASARCAKQACRATASAEAVPNRGEQGQLEPVAEELCERFALYWRHEDLHDAGGGCRSPQLGFLVTTRILLHVTCQGTSHTEGFCCLFAQPCPWSWGCCRCPGTR